MSTNEGFSDPTQYVFPGIIRDDLNVYGVISQLHRDEGGHCSHCTSLANRDIEYPCPTVASMDKVRKD